MIGNLDKNGGPAFPGSHDIDSSKVRAIPLGMTLRDYFAAALRGQAVLFAAASDPVLPPADAIAKLSYEIADAMLKARQS